MKAAYNKNLKTNFACTENIDLFLNAIKILIW
jgi:hypothetical protein